MLQVLFSRCPNNCSGKFDFRALVVHLVLLVVWDLQDCKECQEREELLEILDLREKRYLLLYFP